MVRSIASRCFAAARREVVLSAAIALALLSALIVPPSGAYIAYIDWDTLALLFSLMAVMKGFQQAGVFVCLANSLLGCVSGTRSLLSVLVFLPFLTSMVVTNDVALITFVPFALVVLRMARQERLVVPTVVMQTLAANLGSMLTPMGNPQNLYLYAKSGMSFGALCLLMLPYVLISAACIGAMIVLRRTAPVESVAVPVKLAGRRQIAVYAAGFGLCLLGLFGLVSPLVIAVLIAAWLLCFDRRLLGAVDYSLLGIFAAFFIFIGNISGSNVPAALLLSGFTESWTELIVGCNIGGLGTLIASMASLISYKAVTREYPEQKGRYFASFTVSNAALLAVLLAASYIIM